MPDNLQPVASASSGGSDIPAFALPGRRVLALSGRDAGAFAQAQFMNDVAALPVGQWQWNGWLTPKGRVLALFALLKLETEAVWLLLPDADARELASQLQRYVFRSKVTLTPREDLHVAGAFAAPERASGALLAGDAEGGFELDWSGADAPRCVRISETPAAEDASARARWTVADLEHGLPRLPASQSGQWTPQMLSLDRLRAFSVKKGCYPGQEIVARTHFLGQAKRGMALFEADAPLAPGTEVMDGAQSLGTIVSAAADASRHVALAVLPLERTNAPLSAGGVALHELPLRDGLAR